jgi:hypothetical protein
MVMKLLIPFAVLGVSAVSSAALAVPVSASGPDRPHMIHARHGRHVAPRRPDEGPHYQWIPWELPEGWPGD